MRPVERGPAPRVYKKYGDAIDDLVDRMGGYCSYCERRLPASLAVEHVVPKSVEPNLITTWDNFLLGCTNCNSVKLNKPTNQDDFLWPDIDNTLRVFAYSEGGLVRLSKGLRTPIRAKAQSLMEIVGLDRHPANDSKEVAPRDKRWQQRKDVWDAAVRTKKLLKDLNDAPEAREMVLISAEGYGFFSVWMAVYADHKEIRKGLVQRFKGTAEDCFDSLFQAVKRPKGRI